MNRILKLAMVATAMTSLPAFAAGTHKTNSVEYSNGFLEFLSVHGVPQAPIDAYFDSVQKHGNLASRTALGSRYRQNSESPNDTETAKKSAGGTFTLKGHVNANCSFYNGSSANHTIDLGTIGIRTGDSENVTVAFNQAAAAKAHIDTATAGCNTQSDVEINSDGQGLVNANPGPYDTAQFTAKIPYTLTASWTGSDMNTVEGKPKTLVMHPGDTDVSRETGAWRSAFNMDIDIPAQPKGLVAGDYTSTVTVILDVS